MMANEPRGLRMAAVGRGLIAAAGLLGTASAGAVIIPFTTTFDMRSEAHVFDSRPLDNQQMSSLLSLPRFDASLGVLQGVSLDFDSTWRSFIAVNGSDTNAEVRFGFPPFKVNDTHQTSEGISLMQVRLNDPASAARSLFTPLLSASCSDTSSGSLFDFPASGCRSEAFQDGLFSGSLVGPALNSFIGIDPLDLFVGITTTGQMLDCDSDDDGDVCSSEFVTTWKGSLQLVYTYQPFDVPPGNGGGDPGTDPGSGGNPTMVPEPDTLPLMALSFMVMGLFAVRRARGASSPERYAA